SKKVLRKRRHSSESDGSDNEKEESMYVEKLEEIRELQKCRERPKGVNAATLALGKKIPKTVECETSDPFKMKTGGFIDMKALKVKPLKVDDAQAIGTAFAAETNRRDEDAEMVRYVEDALAKRKGGKSSQDESENSPRPEKREDELYNLPDYLQIKSTSKKSEDMLSNQMLSGIPEIDLGIEAKIKNIEQTEEAKQKLLHERRRKKEKEVSDFVPSNMAVNFVQHNRFNIDDTAPILKKSEIKPEPKPLRVGDVDSLNNSDSSKNNKTEKATDDFHYEKFKKQMRKY
ncbi:hypothetical protein LOTGIDRAFT_55706, partial [Lottia gigantea]